MIEDVARMLAAALILGGSAFALIAAIGLLRLPDLYTRMHAASKAGTVGASMMLLALAMTAKTGPEALRALAAIAFFLLTAPISAHLLARASYLAGVSLWQGSVLDEMPPEEGAVRRKPLPPTGHDPLAELPHHEPDHP
ncbi:monovalent cation/H(+) antiporter subunit G [Aurantimonas sp. Leaf443]|uniref:monovalent cation/H(+) antiporter subunit G n=1 Tax=Aurantimonas sp. Leaf443 TaxID=1736378 RepID=UPI0009E94180|nr:monovalent cation/H(+) antiporter subunit G [Aurantimonas sp. Leaf443]